MVQAVKQIETTTAARDMYLNIEQSTEKHIELLMHGHELMTLKCQDGIDIVCPKEFKISIYCS